MTEPVAGEPTGRYLVLLEDDAVDAGARELNRVAGIRALSTRDVGPDHTGPLIMPELGVAVVSADGAQLHALAGAAAGAGPISIVEPERVVYALEPAAPLVEEPPRTADETTFTWGLQAVGASTSAATGEGIRIAVLDTGLDLQHPDLAGRTLVSRSFIQGEEVQDGHGHGTHCIGTSCGPRQVTDGPGYGVAYRAEIYAGKVLSNRGSGADGGILAGIDWAITNGCAVVSMSLGAPTRPGQPFSQIYERVATRALASGTLIVAAAGNDSSRSDGLIAPLSHPANCPSILAVGAIDVHVAMADFSCGTVDHGCGVDLVGPGVDVHSAWPMPQRTRRISGTSMATPHVAGVAGLVAQATGARAYELWARLVQTAKRLPLPSTDVGSGLVQAP
ncbi:MAG TPA: S8 family serine peptidase [Actinophytocola sp.]|uniref:S8 family peptidase n=1 Tax=Actinophytocola sp. TaxID=1872138 RepID=UPI002DDDAB38|nr:S8 family serine peptidase [Actinophytocola sp.]HEV2783226.1 S8 family serine peptidase [Actinophytocola sp.]